jgi:hypothetical protein
MVEVKEVREVKEVKGRYFWEIATNKAASKYYSPITSQANEVS